LYDISSILSYNNDLDALLFDTNNSSSGFSDLGFELLNLEDDPEWIPKPDSIPSIKVSDTFVNLKSFKESVHELAMQEKWEPHTTKSQQDYVRFTCFHATERLCLESKMQLGEAVGKPEQSYSRYGGTDYNMSNKKCRDKRA
jgi:hypothetical protein